MDAECAGVHNHCMDIAYLSALSALGGSVVGGLISGIATWLSQHEQVMAGKSALDRSRLDDLYRDFLVAASKAYGEALSTNDPKIHDIVDLYAMINRMRILSSPRMVACADKILPAILDTYVAPNKTLRQLHDLMDSGGGPALDLLKEFSEIAREERLAFWGKAMRRAELPAFPPRR